MLSAKEVAARAAKALFNARIVRAFVLGYDDRKLVELEL